MLPCQLSCYMSGLSPQIGGISDGSIVQPSRKLSDIHVVMRSITNGLFARGWTRGLGLDEWPWGWPDRATTSTSPDITRRAGARPSTRLAWSTAPPAQRAPDG